MSYLSALSEVMIHEEALYQVYVLLPLPLHKNAVLRQLPYSAVGFRSGEFDGHKSGPMKSGISMRSS